MALKTFVKASKINNLSDARYFAALEVDYIGFNGLPTSPNYIEPAKQLEIAGWLSGPKYCLDVCGALHLSAEITQQANDLGAIEVDMHFLDWNKLNAQCTVFNRLYLPSSFETAFVETISVLAAYTDYFILDGDVENLDFSELKKYALKEWGKPILVDYTLKTGQLEGILQRIAGISINGGNEEKVGLRSFDDIKDIMESLEIEMK